VLSDRVRSWISRATGLGAVAVTRWGVSGGPSTTSWRAGRARQLWRHTPSASPRRHRHAGRRCRAGPRNAGRVRLNPMLQVWQVSRSLLTKAQGSADWLGCPRRQRTDGAGDGPSDEVHEDGSLENDHSVPVWTHLTGRTCSTDCQLVGIPERTWRRWQGRALAGEPAKGPWPMPVAGRVEPYVVKHAEAHPELGLSQDLGAVPVRRARGVPVDRGADHASPRAAARTQLRRRTHEPWRPRAGRPSLILRTGRTRCGSLTFGVRDHPRGRGISPWVAATSPSTSSAATSPPPRQAVMRSPR
jgi:hypothetical protein